MAKRARRKRAGRRRRRTGVGMAIVGAGRSGRELGGAVESRGLREGAARRIRGGEVLFFTCTAVARAFGLII